MQENRYRFQKHYNNLNDYLHQSPIEPNVYVVTGGAIKLNRTMQEREHTALELEKLNRCKAYLKANGVFDQDSFVELNNEE